MAAIVVCGGSVVGLSVGLLLARDGHSVTVLETDVERPPPDGDAAWASWQRPGVAQFRQAHILLPRVLDVLRQELPDIPGQLVAAGCFAGNLLFPMPPTIQDRAPRSGDERFDFVTGRRPVVEAVLARAAEGQAGVTLRRGVRVRGLLAEAGTSGVPHVSGVILSSGAKVSADLVVDAMGRRTSSSDWLADIGARRPSTQFESHGFAYYTRFFSGSALPERKSAMYTPMGTFSLLTIPGDDCTWSVTVVGASGDAPLKALRKPDVFSRLLGACPAQAHWLDGSPISDVLPMGGLLDRIRSFVVDGRPVVTGMAAVGDAWACTNPSGARGLSLGLVHAQSLRDVIRDCGDDPPAFALAWHERTESVVEPFYRDQVQEDRAWAAELDALRAGGPVPASDQDRQWLGAVGAQDADVFRAQAEMGACLALPRDVLVRPEIRAKLDGMDWQQPTEQGAQDSGSPRPPDRERLLALLGA